MYFIDDSNSTIQYYTGSKPWNHKSAVSTGNLADITKCYDETYTVNNEAYLCSQSDACHFQIPFAGSGITLFVIQSYYALNTTVTLDGNTATIASISNLPRPADLAYNVTLYDVQSLSVGDHTLDVALLDYTLSNGTTVGSLIRFDAAAVNDTSPSAVSPSPSGAGTSTPTANTPAPSASGSGGASHSSSKSGFIVGGAFGGVALLVAFIFAVLYCRRRKTSINIIDIHPTPAPVNFEATPLMFDPRLTPNSSHPPSSPQPYAYATSSRPSFPVTASSDLRTGSYQPSRTSRPSTSDPPSSSASVLRDSTIYPSSTATRPFVVANPEPGRPSHPSQLYSEQVSKFAKATYTGPSPAPDVTTSLPPTVPGSNELTEEQVVFVNNLRGLNVPAAEIARLMEVMRRERQGDPSARISPSNTTFDGDAPPRYDYNNST